MNLNFKENSKVMNSFLVNSGKYRKAPVDGS